MQEKFAASYLSNAAALIHFYKGEEPLHIFLKNYFSKYKKFGSKDRKHISHLCYCFYRVGHSIEHISIEEKIKISLFLCKAEPENYASLFTTTWIEAWKENAKTKVDFIKRNFPSFDPANIFPYKLLLSENIDADKFSASHLIQPDLFIRIRPGRKDTVLQKLHYKRILFKEISNDCFSFDNATKLSDLFVINKEVVIQDYSSQRIKEFFLLLKLNEQTSTSIWDCCTASGGKSILAYDNIKYRSLIVSDVRSSIILNLKKRFLEAGIKNYTSFKADLTSQIRVPYSPFKVIICDVPCTGSGTWGRSPEQLYFFNPEKIIEFQSLQKKIVSNSIVHLETGGYFLYITCSVFKSENEDMALFINENFHLKLIKMEVLKGYDLKADTMFAALFQKL